MAMHISKKSGDDDYESMAEINIIPLVDVMLVLLIIFMVAAPLTISGIGVNLPSSRASGSKLDEKRVVLSINKDGKYYFDQTEIQAKNLEEKMKSIFRAQDSKVLFIRADRDAVYGKVAFAMTSAKLAGVHKMSMLTKQGRPE